MVKKVDGRGMTLLSSSMPRDALATEQSLENHQQT